jgi:LytS/YehU family sensor histidine kinase
VAGWWSRRFGTSIPSVVLGTVAVQAVHHVGLGGALAAAAPERAWALASNVWLHLAKVTATVVGVTLFMGLLQLVRELDLARREVRRSRDQARDARLEALQYQVRPHFLFNILNTLSFTIRTDPPRAREMTLDLAEFLRYTLAGEGIQTTLAAELEQIERYVELERARFGDGLEFSVARAPDEEVRYLPVPPLILQPLVENAIRHGTREGRVRVEIEVERRGDRVVIEVRDDGPGPPGGVDAAIDRARRADDRAPVGLQNVRERLERFYDETATLRLHAREDRRGACAEIDIPWTPGVAEGDTLRAQARERLKDVVAGDVVA